VSSRAGAKITSLSKVVQLTSRNNINIILKCVLFSEFIGSKTTLDLLSYCISSFVFDRRKKVILDLTVIQHEGE